MSNASFSELGIPGYSFADLHEPERLASLHDRFCKQVANADPALWGRWQAYAQAPAPSISERLASDRLFRLWALGLGWASDYATLQPSWRSELIS